MPIRPIQQAGYTAKSCRVRGGNYGYNSGNHIGLKVESLSILCLLDFSLLLTLYQKVTPVIMRFNRHDTIHDVAVNST